MVPSVPGNPFKSPTTVDPIGSLLLKTPPPLGPSITQAPHSQKVISPIKSALLIPLEMLATLTHKSSLSTTRLQPSPLPSMTGVMDSSTPQKMAPSPSLAPPPAFQTGKPFPSPSPMGPTQSTQQQPSLQTPIPSPILISPRLTMEHSPFVLMSTIKPGMREHKPRIQARKIRRHRHSPSRSMTGVMVS